MRKIFIYNSVEYILFNNKNHIEKFIIFFCHQQIHPGIWKLFWPFMEKPATGSRMFFFIFENKNLMLFKIDQPTYNCVTIDVLDAADQFENQNRKKNL